MSVEVLIDDSSLIEHLESKANELPDKLSELVTECALIIQNSVMDEAPVKNHNLQAHTKVENLSEYSSRVYVDEGSVPYALYVICGTAPHFIYPTEKQSLYWPGLDHPMPKGRPVLHPGNQPDPYFERGFAFAQSDINNEVENFKNWLTE